MLEVFGGIFESQQAAEEFMKIVDGKPKLIANTLSEYLMCVLLDALAGVEYSTAQNVLIKNGWEFYEEEYANKEEVIERLSREKIDLSAMVKNMTLYGAADSFCRYCFDEEEKAFYVVINDTSILVIKAE